MIIISTGLFAQNNTQQAMLANEYYKLGEYDKALSIFQEIAEEESVNTLIHSNYLELLEQKQLYSQAENYLKKILAQAPRSINYKIDAINFYIIRADTNQANKLFNDLSDQVIDNYSLLRSAAQLLVNKQHYDYAQNLYLEARNRNRSNTDFAIQLATLYRYQNKLDKMVDEYINYVEESPGRIRYVKSILQLTLKEEEQLINFLQKLLMDIQKDSDNIIYADLIIWANLQLENYYGAFIQAKAMDKKLGNEGANSMEIGKLALKNKEYELAMEIFSFVAETYPQSTNYIEAREMMVFSKKKVIENTYPIDQSAIMDLIQDYQLLLEQEGINRATLQAYRELALLYAFYTENKEKAINILNEIIVHPQSSSYLIAESKIDLGDIYLIIDQPWESSLLYSQVEKEQKNSEIGEKAKLRNAK
ncbi:MAG: hypothetical protein R3321_10115, partial [Nitrososphaeraceae archaeon]|nr:hypothetical protein [Nitrososphaeraceae archaeon]